MIKKLCLLIILAVVPILMAHQNVASATAKDQIQIGIKDANGGSEPVGDPDQTVQAVINILSAVVGAVSIIMIIFAGFRYITSAGNAERTKSAKNTLLFALVGLVLVAMAQTIAHFVLYQSAHPGS